MQEEKRFFRTVCTLAIPAALQSLLQSSFSLVDQIMIGQLGAVSVAAVGLAGKFASIYAVVIAAIGAVAGIMISQYLGQDAPAEVRRSFFTNFWLGFGLAGAFTVLCLLCPGAIMRAYTADAQTLQTAAGYLRLLAGTYLPMAGATMLAAAFRCAEKPRLPLYAGIASALLNTVLNDLLIFGKCGFAAMGAACTVRGRQLTLPGGAVLHGTDVTAPDLRGGAALLAAALAADGETRLRDPGHIPRGYENLPAALRGLGAEIS